MIWSLIKDLHLFGKDLVATSFLYVTFEFLAVGQDEDIKVYMNVYFETQVRWLDKKAGVRWQVWRSIFLS